MMNTCGNCKYWGIKGSEFYSTAIQAKRCANIPHSEDTTEWSDDGDDVLKKEFQDTKAFAMDGSGYHAAIYTKEDFGCNQWEKKE